MPSWPTPNFAGGSRWPLVDKWIETDRAMNVRPTHLLDPELVEAWEHRPEHVRPKTTTVTGPRKMTGTTVRARGLVILNEDASG